MKKSLKKKMKNETIIADVSHGSEWLLQLTEPIFRDEVLKDLFSHMKHEGKITDFLYTHGRNEHGVDWIVHEHGMLSVE